MHIHSRSLKYFDMIRRCGSIREAARQIHVVSSALNRQLIQLEEQVGYPLFERLPSGMKLTAAGEIFARHVMTVMQDEQRLIAELDAFKGVRCGHLRVIAADGLSSQFMPEVLTTMRASYPKVTIEVERAGGKVAAKAVADGDADVAMGFTNERYDGLEQFAMGRFRMGAIVSRSHPLAAKRHTTLAECAQYPLLMPTDEISTFAPLEQAVRQLKRPVDAVMRVGSMNLMYSLALRDVGVAFATQIGIEREHELVHVPFKGLPLLYSELGVYTRANRSRTPALDAFLRIAEAEIDRLVEREGVSAE
jgi:DNA-binding transcriptional LysR family regulator